MPNRVLILSGPTREYIDPVRFIGNASSGRMGRALAEEALRRGMPVDFITGPVSSRGCPAPDPNLTVIPVVSADDMLNAAQTRFAAADLVFLAAAIADFKPTCRQTRKIDKTSDRFHLELTPTPDVATQLCKNRTPAQRVVGFALQTHDGERLAEEKRQRKGLDAIVLNTPASLDADSGHFTWIDASGIMRWGEIDKGECARRIFQSLPIRTPVRRP